MKHNNSITQKELKELLNYHPETGEFTWIKSPRRQTIAGSVAGTLTDTGYIRITIFGVKHKAHRLVWLYVYGEWPDGEIDHIDGSRTNNVLKNLRLATSRQNKQNIVRLNGKSKLPGVAWDKVNNKWSSWICKDYKRIFLGRFGTEEEAHKAYLNAKEELHKFNPIQRTS
jgi:hypothetical protein